MSRLLVFDLEISGHHADYLLFLVKYASLSQYDEIVIVSDRRFEKCLNQFAESHPEVNVKHKIIYHFIPSSLIDEARQKSHLKRSVWEWHTYLDLLETYKADRGLLMYFDLFQLGMIVGKKNLIPTVGIFFRPTVGAHYQEGLKDKITNKLKNKRLALALKRSGIEKVFILDAYSVETLNREEGKTLIKHLPDPVEKYPVLSSGKQEALKAELGIEQNRKVMLIFGHIDDRKGVLQTIRAFRLVESSIQKKVCLLIAGPILDSFKQCVEQEIANLSPDAQVIVSFKEYKFEKIQHLFDISDLVLVLYQKHIGMSSVVVRAAISAKPVLTSNYGMIAKYVLENKLGGVLDAEDDDAIAKGINNFVLNGMEVDAQKQMEVSNYNSPKSFANTLLSLD